MKNRRFGSLPPRYSLMLNPYPEERLWRCPCCERKMGQRKLPLLIHVDPQCLMALNYTCRYCAPCDLLVAHKFELEHLLYQYFSQTQPDAVGNSYLILGTVEKKVWREGYKDPQKLLDFRSATSDFKTYFADLRLTCGGYYHVDQEPPIMEPPPSLEWVKATPSPPLIA